MSDASILISCDAFNSGRRQGSMYVLTDPIYILFYYLQSCIYYGDDDKQTQFLSKLYPNLT